MGVTDCIITAHGSVYTRAALHVELYSAAGRGGPTCSHSVMNAFTKNAVHRHTSYAPRWAQP
eukprot:4582877-Prymnesium_polylepis.1